MRATTWKTATALMLALAVTAPLEAQGRGNGRDRDRDDDRREVQRTDDERSVRDGRSSDRDRSVRDGRETDRNRSVFGGTVSDRDRDDDRQRAARRDSRNERGNGPSFCRSGRGHPVFGWDWCRERGWDRSNSRYPVKWERRTWDDVIFRRDDRRGVLDRRGLGDVLGDVVFGRIDTRRREMGSSGDWIGRWANTSTGRELWITAGGVPIARLIDRNGDRRVDSVYLAER